MKLKNLRNVVRPTEGRILTPEVSLNDILLPGDKLIYCEGFATGVIPVHHAWLLYDNQVIDPTWDHMKEINDRKPEYFGIPFKLEYVAKTIRETEYYSVLDNWVQRFPLLTGVHKIEDVTYA